MASSPTSLQNGAGRRSGNTTRDVLSCEPSPGWLWSPPPSPTSVAGGLTRNRKIISAPIVAAPTFAIGQRQGQQRCRRRDIGYDAAAVVERERRLPDLAAQLR